jgi:hypothetical protein
MAFNLVHRRTGRQGRLDVSMQRGLAPPGSGPVAEPMIEHAFWSTAHAYPDGAEAAI